MYLRLLGTVSLRDDAGHDAHRDLTQPKRVGLLAYLAVQPAGDLVRRDTLLALLWPELPERDARRALNQAVHYLRGILGAQAVVSGGAETLGVDPKVVQCDVRDFDLAVREGKWSDALELYRGALMDGFNLNGLPEFDDWLTRERTLRARSAAAAAWALAESSDTSPSDAIRCGNRAYAILADEGAARRLIALHDGLGDRAEAVHIYESFARRLADEYGAEPAPETKALIAGVMARSEPNTSPTMPGPVGTAVRSTASAVARSPWSHVMRRRSVVAACLAALGIAGGLLALRANTSTGAAGAAGNARVVAILPFDYRGAPSLSYLGEGVASLLASSIDGTANLRTVDPHALFGAVARRSNRIESIADARPVARDFGAGVIVLGDVTESSGRLRISAASSEGGAVGDRIVVEGDASDLFHVVDELAAKLLAGRRAADARSSASITTNSVAALRAYLAGNAEYRGGRYAAAVQALRRAVDADSTFALAQYLLANAASWTGETQLVERATAAAYAHRDRLTPRDRAKVEAFRLLQAVKIDSAASAYDALVRADPTDVEAAFQLADIHFHWGATFGRPVSASGGEWSRVIALDPTNAGALLHAARVAAMDGDRARFDSLDAQIDRLDVDPDRSIELAVIRAFAFGDSTARAAAAARLGAASEPVRTDIVLSAPAWSRTLAGVGDQLYPTLFARNGFESREDGQMLLRAEIEFARGETAASAATVDSARLLDPAHAEQFKAAFAIVPHTATTAAERRRIAAEYAAMPQTTYRRANALQHYLLAMLALRDGDTAIARAHYAALDTVSAASVTDTAYARRMRGIVGAELRRAAGDPAGALAMLGPPRMTPDGRLPHVWTFPIAHERFLRGELAEAVGRFDEAQRWYATFPDPRTYDVMYYPAALERSAALYEKGGDRERASAIHRELSMLRTR